MRDTASPRRESKVFELRSEKPRTRESQRRSSMSLRNRTPFKGPAGRLFAAAVLLGGQHVQCRMAYAWPFFTSSSS
jgi:hypothetical protein